MIKNIKNIKNIKICICIVFLGIILIILHMTPNKTNMYGGEEETEMETDDLGTIDNIDCTMEQIEKHNKPNDKWIYNNGQIYNLTLIIEAEIINSDVNIDNIIKFFKSSEEQDLSKLLGSIEMYNDVMRKYNEKNPDDKLIFFDFSNLDESKITETNTRIKEKEGLFNKFKFIFIKSVAQFSKGIICPAGLKI